MTGRSFLLTQIPRGARGVEVGVWTGGFSERLLEETEPSELTLVDPWIWDQGDIPKNCYIATTRLAKNQADMDRIYESVVKKFAGRTEVRVVRKKSVEAAADFDEASLDWIYIDGSHDYDSVKADLNAWKSKLVVGGLLTGDDYMWGHQYKHPVKRAVDEFLKLGEFEKVSIDNKTGQFILKRIK